MKSIRPYSKEVNQIVSFLDTGRKWAVTIAHWALGYLGEVLKRKIGTQEGKEHNKTNFIIFLRISLLCPWIINLNCREKTVMSACVCVRLCTCVHWAGGWWGAGTFFKVQYSKKKLFFEAAACGILDSLDFTTNL